MAYGWGCGGQVTRGPSSPPFENITFPRTKHLVGKNIFNFDPRILARNHESHLRLTIIRTIVIAIALFSCIFFFVFFLHWSIETVQK